MIGIDEVGRGCWAGPLLVVAARQRQQLPKGLKDSKLLTKRQREQFFDEIENACEFGAGWVSAREIDGVGLGAAMVLAVARSLKSLKAAYDEEVIIDGHINYCPPKFKNSMAVIDADASHPIVSAASIYAKVLRDKFMTEQAKRFPGYGFEKHVGYGTMQHVAALKQYGVCELHRLSYKPVKTHL